MFFIGAGINVFNGLPPIGPQPNNGVVRPINITGTEPEMYRLRFFCRSNSTAKNVGELIGLGGIAITSSNFFEINTGKRGGELEVASFVSSDDVTSSEQGVYTCRIPLQSGVIRDINIGIYPTAFKCELIVVEISPGILPGSLALPLILRVVVKSPV